MNIWFILEIEKIDGKEGSKITFDDVFLVVDKKKVKIGTPLVSSAKIKAEIIGQIKGEKIKVFKYKPKKRYRRAKGHRQFYTRIKILDIEH